MMPPEGPLRPRWARGRPIVWRSCPGRQGVPSENYFFAFSGRAIRSKGGKAHRGNRGTLARIVRDRGTQIPAGQRMPLARVPCPYNDPFNIYCPVFGAPGGIRTPNLLIRSQVLYPVELRAQGREGPRGYSKPPLLASRPMARFRALGTVPGGRRFARMGLLGFRGCETASTPIESL